LIDQQHRNDDDDDDDGDKGTYNGQGGSRVQQDSFFISFLFVYSIKRKEKGMSKGDRY